MTNLVLQDELDFVLNFKEQKIVLSNRQNTDRVEKATQQLKSAQCINGSMMLQNVRKAFLKKFSQQLPPLQSEPLKLRSFLKEMCQVYQVRASAVFDDYFSLAKFRSLTAQEAASEAWKQNLQQELHTAPTSLIGCSYIRCQTIEQLFELQPGQYTFFMGYYFTHRLYWGWNQIFVYTKPIFEQDDRLFLVGVADAILLPDNKVEVTRIVSADFPSPFSLSLGKIMYAILMQYLVSQKALVVMQQIQSTHVANTFEKRFGFKQVSNNSLEHQNIPTVLPDILSWAKASVLRFQTVCSVLHVKPFQLFTIPLLQAAILTAQGKTVTEDAQLVKFVDQSGQEVKLETVFDRMLIGGSSILGLATSLLGYSLAITYMNPLPAVLVFLAGITPSETMAENHTVAQQTLTNIPTVLESPTVFKDLKKLSTVIEDGNVEELQQTFHQYNWTNVDVIQVEELLLERWWNYLESGQDDEEYLKDAFDTLHKQPMTTNSMEEELLLSLRRIHLQERFFGKRRAYDEMHQMMWAQLLTSEDEKVSDIQTVESKYRIRDPKTTLSTIKQIVEYLDKLMEDVQKKASVENVLDLEQVCLKRSNMKDALVSVYQTGVRLRFHDLRYRLFRFDPKWKSLEQMIKPNVVSRLNFKK